MAARCSRRDARRAGLVCRPEARPTPDTKDPGACRPDADGALAPLQRACFTRAQRLLRPKQFERVFADACKSSDGLLVVLGRANDVGIARLGLAMSRKHLKTSPARNRVKRIVRGNFRLQAAELGAVDFVVMARAGAMGATNAELHRAAQRHLRNVARKIKGG